MNKNVIYNEILEDFFQGKYRNVQKKIEKHSENLNFYKILELKALYNISIGEIDHSWKSTIFSKFITYIYLKNKIFSKFLSSFISLSLFIPKLTSNAALFVFFYTRYVPIIIHLRYTNFVSGLVLSKLLSSFTKNNNKMSPIYDNFYFTGTLGHFECLGGRFDFGLNNLKNAYSTLIAYQTCHDDKLQNNDLYRKMMDVIAMYFYQLENAGFHEDAKIIFKIFNDYLNRKYYHYVEIFIRSMRMISSVEMIDEKNLKEDITRLKKVLGKGYFSLYALRASIFSALADAINHDFQNLYIKLINSEKYYNYTKLTLELWRYHIIHAQIDVEMNNTESALHHIQRAKSYSMTVSGGRFHNYNSELLDLEIKLRILFQNPNITTLSKKFLYSSLNKVDKIDKSIKGSILIEYHCNIIRALIFYLSENFTKYKKIIAILDKQKNIVSKRLYFVLNHFDNNTIQKIQSKISDKLIKRTIDLSLISQLNTLLNCTNIPKTSCAIIKKAFGADECELEINYKTSKKINIRNADYHFQMINETIAELMFVTYDNSVLNYKIINPINNINFDNHLKKFIELAISIIKQNYNTTSIIASERTSAIISTTQMLAHDIGKSFKIVKNLISAFDSINIIPDNIQNILKQYMPEIKKSHKNIENMIEDIMMFGRESILFCQPLSIKKIIEELMREINLSYDISKINISYDYQHKHMVAADQKKIKRVFSNLMINAVQTLYNEKDGKIWFETIEVKNGFIQICIGNNKTYVPENLREKIFNSFFTAGKANGSGLGLAIVKKIINEHGGNVWCESSKVDSTIEFYFTLKILNKLDR